LTALFSRIRNLYSGSYSPGPTLELETLGMNISKPPDLLVVGLQSLSLGMALGYPMQLTTTGNTVYLHLSGEP
jgi:hypothetical protein